MSKGDPRLFIFGGPIVGVLIMLAQESVDIMSILFVVMGPVAGIAWHMKNKRDQAELDKLKEEAGDTHYHGNVETTNQITATNQGGGAVTIGTGGPVSSNQIQPAKGSGKFAVVALIGMALLGAVAVAAYKLDLLKDLLK